MKKERALEGEAASLEARAASAELENGSLKRARRRRPPRRATSWPRRSGSGRGARRARREPRRRGGGGGATRPTHSWPRAAAPSPRVAALEAELEEVRAAARRRDADAALNLRDGVALATGDAEARLAAALRERDAAQSLVATTRTELRNITSERDALRKREERRPADGAGGGGGSGPRRARGAPARGRGRERCADASGRRRGASKAPDRALEDESRARCARLEPSRRTRASTASSSSGSRRDGRRALAQRDATKREADAAVARARSRR